MKRLFRGLMMLLGAVTWCGLIYLWAPFLWIILGIVFVPLIYMTAVKAFKAGKDTQENIAVSNTEAAALESDATPPIEEPERAPNEEAAESPVEEPPKQNESDIKESEPAAPEAEISREKTFQIKDSSDCVRQVVYANRVDYVQVGYMLTSVADMAFVKKDDAYFEFETSFHRAKFIAERDGVVKWFVPSLIGKTISQANIEIGSVVCEIDYSQAAIEAYNEAKRRQDEEFARKKLEEEMRQIAEKMKEKQRKDELKKIVRQKLIESGELFDDQPKRPRLSREVVDAVYKRDGGCCVYCGSTNNLQLDHIIPFSRGGATTVENLQLLCQKCNLEKSNKIG